jgi:hypothetical protein
MLISCRTNKLSLAVAVVEAMLLEKVFSSAFVNVTKEEKRLRHSSTHDTYT